MYHSPFQPLAGENPLGRVAAMEAVSVAFSHSVTHGHRSDMILLFPLQVVVVVHHSQASPDYMVLVVGCLMHL